jgi:hypothetical protein
MQCTDHRYNILHLHCYKYWDARQKITVDYWVARTEYLKGLALIAGLLVQLHFD